MITSTQNSKIQWVRKLIAQKKERDASGCYVIEGVRLMEEVIPSQDSIRFAVYANPLTDRARELLTQLSNAGVELEEIPDWLMKSISDTSTPQGLLAVAEAHPLPLPLAPKSVVVLDGIHDPGNLGTLFRTAAAAGVDLLLLAPGCADPYSPKVIRSAMGTHVKLPFARKNWQEIQQLLLDQYSLQVFAAAMEGGKSLWEQDLSHPNTLIIGSEAEGICAAADQLAHDKIFIPMTSGVESLNAAVAASILMFENARQKNLLH